jgi:hypothetical protein
MMSLNEMMGKVPDQAMRAFFTDLCRIRQLLPMEVWNLVVIVGSEAGLPCGGCRAVSNQSGLNVTNPVSLA